MDPAVLIVIYGALVDILCQFLSLHFGMAFIKPIVDLYLWNYLMLGDF